MTKHKKPSLKKALRRVDQRKSVDFGNVEIDILELPCIKRSAKQKITANFDKDLLQEIKHIAKKHNVSYSNLMNDVLRKFFMKN